MVLETTTIKNNVRSYTDAEFKLISKIGSGIISTLDIKEVIRRIYCNLNKLMDASVFTIGIYNKIKNVMDIWGIDIHGQVVLINDNLELKDTYWLSYCFKNQVELLVNDYATGNYNHSFPPNVFNDVLNVRQSFIYVPLTINKNHLGIMTVQSYNSNAYTNKHFDIIKNLSTIVAAALQNACNYQRIKEQSDEIINNNKRILYARNNLEEVVRTRTCEVQKQNRELENINKELEMLSIVARETENAVMIMDALGNVLWINDYFTRIYKYTLEEFIQKRGANILETSFNPEIENAVRKCISEKKAVVYEALNIAIDGSELWTQTTLTPILNDIGEIENLVTIDTNITKRKKAEAKVRKQNKNITDSIKYASRIQKAVMPNNIAMKSMFGDYFVINKPRNIVSGDFYWAKSIKFNEKNYKILAVADCTGHGVPGAFVSMLGITLLTDIISSCSKDRDCLDAADILEELRRRIIHTLNQKGYETETKDGMDMALAIIDEEQKEVNYAGANNPIYHVSYKNNQTELEKIKATKSPIGLCYKEKPYESKVLNFNAGDKLYLFTDGVVDQFGGEEGRKLMAKNFRKLILKTDQQTMCKQRLAMNEQITNWIGEYDQVDDILIVGIKL